VIEPNLSEVFSNEGSAVPWFMDANTGHCTQERCDLPALIRAIPGGAAGPSTRTEAKHNKAALFAYRLHFGPLIIKSFGNQGLLARHDCCPFT
jgi:hypothetical protein